MIQYITNRNIDKTKWDSCIQNSFNGMIYGYSWFLDLVSEEWDALVEDDYQRIFPLTWRKKAGIYYLHQPFFTQQLGIFSKSPLEETTVSQFLDSIPDRFRLIEISLNSFNAVSAPAYSVRKHLNHELSLTEDYDQLAKGYSENTRRSIRKALNQKLTCHCETSPDEVIRLFRRNRGRSVHTLKDKDYSKLRRLVYTCIHKGKARIWGAYSPENQLCAGIIFLFSHDRAIFLFSGLDSYGREHGAMPFLIDAFIKEHAHSYLTLDFEGSNDPDLARFYRSFGSREVTYPFITRYRLPMMIRILKKLRTGISKRRTTI
ncbi:MAG: GNAT family N-acetyltransferase [Bacteroidales bacterium]|nr:GNAT family N-acetyltransferase [Lentimicrobiaceae bacterium]MDD5695977.1 GNAT family N-acetyltransferase [Bacteroidales bacterium]